MKSFLRKYWVNFLVALILLLLLLLLIPNQEKHYLSEEQKLISQQSTKIVLLLLSVVGLTLFLIGLRHTKKIEDAVIFIFGIILFVAPFYFLLSPIFLSSTYFLNMSKTKSRPALEYRVLMTDSTDAKSAILWELKEENHIYLRDILKKDTTINIHNGDTVKVEFSKGLFGYNFDPVLKPD